MPRFLRSWRHWFVLLGVVTSLAAARPGFVLEIDASNTQGSTVQLFYNLGQNLSNRDSVGLELPADPGWHTLRFSLPAEPIKQLRLDPANEGCVIRFGRMRLFTADGRLLRDFGPECLRPMWAIESISLQQGVATVRTKANNNDPMLIIDEPLQRLTQETLGRATLGTPTILILGALAALMLIGSFIAALGCALRQAAAPGERQGRMAWAVFGGVMLVVTGARLAWLKAYSGPMPFWDEWDANGLYLLMPWRGHYLDWQAMFMPQNEHRSLLTRLIALVGTIFNGEWDPRIGMTISTVLFGANLGLIAIVALRAGRWIGLAAAALLAGLAALPFDFMNLLWGDQTCMYSLFLLATVILVLSTAREIRPALYLAAAAAGSLSLVTMGSGFIAPGLAAVICAGRWLTEKDRRRQLAVLAVIFGAIALAGFCCRADSHFHGPSYARTLAAFWPAFKGFGAWPLPPDAGWLWVRFAPWLLLCGVMAWRRTGNALDWLAFGLGAWSLLSVYGLAYARPASSPPTDSRHFTVLFLGLVAMLICALALWAAAGPTWRRWLALGPLVAALAGLGSLWPIETAGLASTRQQPYWRAAHDEVVLPFLRSGDRTLMQDLPGDGKCPYWNSAILATYLESPLLQPILPAKLRRAIAERPGSPWKPGDIQPGFYTLAARTLMKLGLALALIGVALFGLAIWLGFRPRQTWATSG